MGRRSRKRGGAPASRAEPGAHAAASGQAPPAPRTELHERPRSRRAPLEEAPKAPWAPVPLTEICIFLGLVVLGFAVLGGGSRGIMLAFGLALVTLATLELSLREHLAGFRSHSALLAGICAMVVAVPVAVFAGLSKALVLVIAAVVFFAAFQLLRDAFRRRAGGMSWRA